MTVQEEYDELYVLVQKSGLLGSIGELLSWDREILSFPKGNMDVRVKESSLLTEIHHDMATNPRIGELCASLSSQELTDEQSAFVREVFFDYNRISKVPQDLAKRMTEKQIEATDVWAKAREQNDFAMFAPFLQEMVDLQKEYAAAVDSSKPVYEVLFEDYEPGMSLTQVNELFDGVKEFLIPLVKKISQANQVEALPLFDIDHDTQLSFQKKVAGNIGYDFSNGMLEESVHPFTGYLGRMTTRFTQGWVEAIMGTLHESGHGMYEQNLPSLHRGTPFGQARSLGIHESQSRFWENIIGRSKPFASWLFPQLKDAYGAEHLDMSLDEYYVRLNRVQSSLNRVSSDEVTYTLHILLRFELEQEIFSGNVNINDLPRIWNEKMQNYLGVVPPTDSEGVLQDVHWSYGLFSYFPTYALGNIIASQLFESMNESLPVYELVEKGDFTSIKEWLVENIHKHGRTYETADLIQRATGKPLSVDAYKRYLESKYAQVYHLE